ncbi:putative disease resistance RPP13-like protein 1 [Glycine soja]|uniref:Putative disease resistance RPP13-like protein 1 n=1 Tax=Glycine soja TaxID=3848 RepID=A0A445L6W5_GLYSO|nr:putative disease resistance RPP13-like protein 1 [Glycine soja]
MAAALVGGAFLSAFLDVLFDRLASPDFVDLIRGKKLSKKLLQKLETTLRVVGAVLDDAEKKQITNTNVKHWLDDLKDAVYEADDLLDHVFTKAATQNKVRDLFSRFSDRKIVSKLEDIVVTLESRLKLKESLDLKESAVENLSWKAPSTSLEDGSHIYGREKDKEAIIKLLSEDNSDGSEVSVVPIVGMGGVGKTTLAQLVYNDENLKQIFDFDFKAWVCVSQEFDVLKVTKTIIEAVTGKPCKLNDLNLLHLELMDKLKDKKFLIVLDDVWTEDYVDWRLLKKPFNRGIIRRSKILLTTRSEKTASVVQTVHTYHLNQLSNEDCWSVFANHACLYSESNENTTTLEKIGKEIIKKCNGLPLAAESLGGMLRRKHDIGDWNNILNSDIWELSESECKVIPALRLSYHYLPAHLKRCFVYCSLYPQDYEFEKNELILLWMAEDLLKKPRNGRILEEVGHEYFDDLVSRSFFQRSSTNRSSWPYGKCFVMHDLMHDLATSLGGDFYFRSEELGKETKINTKTRHLSFAKFNSSVLDNFDVVGRTKFLRTFLSIINFEAAPFNNEEAQCIIVSKLMYLRVLSFRDFRSLDSLPDSIEGYKGTRFPDWMGNSSYCNMTGLYLSDCDNCSMLPSLGQLPSLKDLEIARLNRLKTIDAEAFPVLKSLKIRDCPKLEGSLPNHLPALTTLVIRNCEQLVSSLPTAPAIQSLVETIEVEGSPMVESMIEAITNIQQTCLRSLTLRDCSSAVSFPGGRLPESLKTLRIWDLKKLEFPTQHKHELLETLSIESSCDSLTSLPLVTFPNLRDLAIRNCENMEYLLVSGAESFKSLCSLRIYQCPNFVSFWREGLPAPNLITFKVWGSDKLKSLPDEMSTLLPKLEHLYISYCPEIESFPEGGMPPNLRTVWIVNCEKLLSGLAWPSMGMLTHLSVGGRCDGIKSFPKEGLLPPSLTSLYLYDLSNLEMLDCTGLLHLTSLQILHIDNCPLLENMAGERLPVSLIKLTIMGCPLLEKRCRKKHPQIWPKISHIPGIQVDDRWI